MDKPITYLRSWLQPDLAERLKLALWRLRIERRKARYRQRAAAHKAAVEAAYQARMLKFYDAQLQIPVPAHLQGMLIPQLVAEADRLRADRLGAQASATT